MRALGFYSNPPLCAIIYAQQDFLRPFVAHLHDDRSKQLA
jgi:hypothetical protein